MKPFFWRLGLLLMACGAGAVTAGLLLVELGAFRHVINSVLPTLALAGAISFLSGAFVVWAFSFRFYFSRYSEHSTARNVTYLILILCTTWLSPFILLGIEGQRRFFS